MIDTRMKLIITDQNGFYISLKNNFANLCHQFFYPKAAIVFAAIKPLVHAC